MGYHVFDSADRELAGDAYISRGMKKYADDVHGYIKDMSTGKIVYPADKAQEED